MDGEFTLLKEFELTGKWWFPENPKIKLYGHLKFKRDYITLEVSGIFKKKHIFQLLESDVMYGCTNKNKKITLCHVAERYFEGAKIANVESDRDSGKSIYSIEYIFIGRHYNQINNINLVYLSADFTYLDKWINNKIDCKLIRDDNYTINMEKIEYELYLKYIDSVMYISSLPPILSGAQNSIEINFTSRIGIRPNEAKSWRWFEELIINLRNLLALFIGHPVYPISLTAQPGDQEAHDLVQIFYAIPDPVIYEDLHPREIGIPFKNLINYSNQSNEVIADVINTWLIKLDKLEPVFDLFFLSFYDTSMKPYLRFLTLMQAFEIFHRRVCGGTYLSANDYKPIRKALMKAIPDELNESHKNNLISKISSGNEFPLKMRLMKLTDYSPFKWFKTIIKIESDDEDGFIGKLVNTRNHYTHFNESKKPIFNDEEILRINYELIYLLRVFLISEIDSKGLLNPSDIFNSFTHRIVERKQQKKFEDS
jgi:hypothetical protein